MPEDTLLDDFMLSMGIAQKGYRIAYTPDAYAVESGSLNMEEEAKRKDALQLAAGSPSTGCCPYSISCVTAS